MYPSETATDRAPRLRVEAFQYLEAPWEPPVGASGLEFREVEVEPSGPEGASVGADGAGFAPAEAGKPASAPGNGSWEEELPIAVRYQYRVEPGYEEQSRDLETASEGSDAAARAEAGQQELGQEEAGQGKAGLAEEQEEEDQRLFRELLAGETAKAEERGRLEGFEAGRKAGFEAGLGQGRTETLEHLNASVQAERERMAAQAAALTRSFVEAQETGVHRLEQETARLALAIAARILRREAAADPLLVTGAVRVALGQLPSSATVRLRVPAQDRALWEEALRRMPKLPLRPVVVGDPGMKLGDCRMETELGTADLGLESQLREVERSFFAPELEQASESWAAAADGAEATLDETGLDETGLDGTGLDRSGLEKTGLEKAGNFDEPSAAAEDCGRPDPGLGAGLGAGEEDPVAEALAAERISESTVSLADREEAVGYAR